MKEICVKELHGLVSSLNNVQFIRTRRMKYENLVVCVGQMMGG